MADRSTAGSTVLDAIWTAVYALLLHAAVGAGSDQVKRLRRSDVSMPEGSPIALLVVMALLSLIILPPALGNVRLAARAVPHGPIAAGCSGFYSDVQPPSTLRVLYNFPNGGDNLVHIVDFKFYVNHVLPNEWVSSWGMSSLRTGAAWIRTYAWYWTNHWRGGSASNGCYDVDSTKNYQVYDPNFSPPSNTQAAVDSIWVDSRLYRHSGSSPALVFEANYVSGNQGDSCGQDGGSSAPGWQGSQFGTEACDTQGLQWTGITRRYYFANSSASNPDNRGDVTILDDSPAAASFHDASGDHLDVFALDRSSNVWIDKYSSGSWTGWATDLGGGCTSNPSATSYTSTDVWVFCRDSSGYVQGKRYNGSGWDSSWTELSGLTVQSAPGVTDFYYQGSHMIYIWAVGWDDLIYVDTLNLSTRAWSGWQGL